MQRRGKQVAVKNIIWTDVGEQFGKGKTFEV